MVTASLILELLPGKTTIEAHILTPKVNIDLLSVESLLVCNQIQ